jgi:hypothetical protein
MVHMANGWIDGKRSAPWTVEKSREANKRSYAKYREKRIKATYARYHGPKHEEIKAQGRERYWRNRSERLAKSAERYLRVRYRLTAAERRSMLADQNWICAICLQPITEQTCRIDHDHVTGDVRWLLCNGCNRGLGFFDDNPASLERAALLLKERRTTQ